MMLNPNMLRNLKPPFHNPITTRHMSSFLPKSSDSSLREAIFEAKIRSFDSLLSDSVDQKALTHGQSVHAQIVKTCHALPLRVGTRLVVLYGKCDCLADALKVLDEMPERSVVTWTAAISAHARRGLSSDALSLFLRMTRAHARPNEFTFASVLTACTNATMLRVGTQIHCAVVKWGLELHVFVASSLLDMYAKSGMIDNASEIFDCLPEKDVVACTAIVSGYTQLGLDEDAVKLFRRLLMEGMVPNYVTYTSLLTALSGLTALTLGREVHGRFIRLKERWSIVLQNSLIDMYAKCGNLNYARKMFDEMTDRTVVSWNAMLVGYSKHGKGREVIELFEVMKQENQVKPVSVTFLAVLSGCSHCGLEDRGLEIFAEMESGNYGPEFPEMTHYACVVDLLGRTGRTLEAFRMVKTMPFEPTAAVWGSLLGACKVHSDIGIGEIAARKLLDIEPENAGNYVVLSNLYAGARRWDDMAVVRALMRERVAKEPGQSRIELGRVVHTFHAGERSHPRRAEAEARVGVLAVELRGAGYVPDLSCVLYDVDDETKERMLLSHSEKLAIGFALVAGGEGQGPIRVIKNLRICVDCHNFAKVFSRVYGREVSLRDKTRFHCIVDGVCSCGDHW